MGQIALEVHYLKKWYFFFFNFDSLLQASLAKKPSNPYISELILRRTPQKYNGSSHQCSCLFRKYNKQVCLSDGQPDRGLKHTMCTGPGQVVDPTRLRAGLSQLTLAWAPRPAPVQWWEEEGGLHEGWVVSTDKYLMGSCEGEGRYVFLEVCEFYCGFHE